MSKCYVYYCRTCQHVTLDERPGETLICPFCGSELQESNNEEKAE